MVAPIERGECDVVLGSRMMTPGAARRGGMPLYKQLGNRALTTFENRMIGTELSEFHSGYRAYRLDALAAVPLERTSDDFDFDTQILIQLHHAGKHIVEIPIPTYYGDEICYVNGLRYGMQISAEAARYRMALLGLGSGPRCLGPEDLGGTPYELKEDEDSSHGQILAWLAARPPGRVLDLGCSSGLLAERVRKLGHQVVGVDRREFPEVADRLDRFIRADLDDGIPAEVGDGFDVVVAADLLADLRRPGDLVRELRRLLAPEGTVLVSVPNFGHWYPRLRTALGHFDYDQRGILDREHLRFFTKRTIEQLFAHGGYDVRKRAVTSLPLSVLGAEPPPVSLLSRFDRAAAVLRPELFAYQLLYEVAPQSHEPPAAVTVTVGVP